MSETPGDCAPSARARRVVWGATAAVGLTFVEAIVRLGWRAAGVIERGLSTAEWLALALAVASFTYLEGHRALYLRFAPAFAARALEEARTGSQWAPLRAPLRGLSLIGDRRAMARGWAAVLGIVTAVVMVRALPDPWRAMIGAGVASALSWGLIGLVSATRRAVDAAERSPGREPESVRSEAWPAPSPRPLR